MRAFEESSKKEIIETNNLEAFGALDSNIMGASRVEKHNPTDYDSQEALWKCVIKYVYPRRFKLAMYLALLGGAELMDLDIGLGP